MIIIIKIYKNQNLDISNVMSVRASVLQDDITDLISSLESYIKECGAKQIGSPISTTYDIDPQTAMTDIQIYIAIDIKIPSKDKFIFMEKFFLCNCLIVRHEGSASELENTLEGLNNYIIQNKLIPISPGYNILLKQDGLPDNVVVDIYISMNPNIT